MKSHSRKPFRHFLEGPPNWYGCVTWLEDYRKSREKAGENTGELLGRPLRVYVRSRSVEIRYGCLTSIGQSKD